MANYLQIKYFNKIKKKHKKAISRNFDKQNNRFYKQQTLFLTKNRQSVNNHSN